MSIPNCLTRNLRPQILLLRSSRSFGIEVTQDIGGTHIVGVLEGNNGKDRSIDLRADMDALAITEMNDFDHKPTNTGAMHACGHDGHTTMLLGAARYLVETHIFSGRIIFIFQPAEKWAVKTAAQRA